MATVWDAARALLAMTGSEAAAVAAARDLAATFAAGHENDEAAFWTAVIDAIAWETNPQPLIAPSPSKTPPGRSRFLKRGLELPQHRSNVLRFQRDLRELLERYRPEGEAPRDEKKDE
jgi:hypothetical protein